MAERRYPPRRPPPKRRGSVDHLSSRQVGLGPGDQIALFVLALFPLVGIVIGTYYAAQDHFPTRSFGRLLMAYAFILHFAYFCVICPLLLYSALL